MQVTIDWLNLAFGTTLVLIPVLIMIFFKVNLIKNLIYSLSRTIIQLLLVGIFLKYIFEWNNFYLNAFWLLMIIYAGGSTVTSRSEINKKIILKPVIIGFLIAFSISTIFVGFLYFGGKNYFNARFIIPISGMLIGNSISTLLVGIRSLFTELKNRKDLYEYYLIGTGSTEEASKRSVKIALNNAFKPMLANISTIGLIWLPGTMTGQIIAGQSPIEAIKYQLLIVIGYFSTCFIATFITLMLARKNAYDEYGVLKT